MKNLIQYTNEKISQFYFNAKKEFGIIGSGSLKFENEKAIIEYTENNEKKTWSMYWHESYLKTQKIDYIFNCWMELA